MKKEYRKHRLTLTLLTSLFVFLIIAVAVALSILLVYLMIRFHILDATNGQPRISLLFLMITLSSTILGFLITMWSSRVSLKPLNQLINQLNRLAKGEFTTRISFGRPFQRMAVFQEVAQSFNTAAQELEHTEMLRGDFINNFSHEFKTPIVSIAGFAKLLRRGNLTEEQKEEYLAVIEEESLRLSYMATNVLNLTKVENQAILTDVTTYNLSEQIRSALLLLADKWTQKNLKLDIELQEYTIEANEELLKQIWINLLDNAIKFSEAGGMVTVEGKVEGDYIAVTISNRGNKIPRESIERIFQKFYQADESHSSEGNGIGLAIVKKVVELHRGTVGVVSENGRTTFTVWLPLRQG